MDGTVESVLASSSVGKDLSARRTPLLGVEMPHGFLQRANVTGGLQKQAMIEATWEVTRFFISNFLQCGSYNSMEKDNESH